MPKYANPCRDEDRFRAAVASSSSIREVIVSLGLGGGGSYNTVKRYAEKYEISLPRDPYKQAEGAKKRNRRPDSEVFCENSTYTSQRGLKTRLLEFGWAEECVCGQGAVWWGKPLVIQLDHINGVSNDNRLENLRFLCPNCHTQTATYGGKNRKSAIRYPEKSVLDQLVKTFGVKSVANQLDVSESALRHKLRRNRLNTTL